jgi:hypothetical protein
MAGGGRPDLRPGEEKLSTAQVGPHLARDASGNRGRPHSHLTRIRLLWAVEHRLHRAGESDRPPWNSCAGTTDVGHGTAVPSSLSPSGVVAGLLPFCASSRSTACEARTAAGARWQTSGTTLSPVNSGDGSRENEPTVDSKGSALMPLAAGFCLRATEARAGCSIIPPRRRGRCLVSGRGDLSGLSNDENTSLKWDCTG